MVAALRRGRALELVRTIAFFLSPHMSGEKPKGRGRRRKEQSKEPRSDREKLLLILIIETTILANQSYDVGFKHWVSSWLLVNYFIIKNLKAEGVG